jgi:hypothetical protein
LGGITKPPLEFLSMAVWDTVIPTGSDQVIQVQMLVFFPSAKLRLGQPDLAVNGLGCIGTNAKQLSFLGGAFWKNQPDSLSKSGEKSSNLISM